MSKTKNILALLDFSNITERIVERAGELATLYDAKCWLVHIAEPEPDFVGYDVGPQYVRDHKAAKLHDEHQKLQDFKKKLERSGVRAEALLIQGPINQSIDGEIKKLNIDLIVMGSHGRSRLYELLVGSACEYVLKHHNLPMFIIPGQEPGD